MLVACRWVESKFLSMGQRTGSCHAADLQNLLGKIQVQGEISIGDSIPIPDALKNLILDGLQAVVNIADSLDDNSLFQKQLPLVNKSIAMLRFARPAPHEYEPNPGLFPADNPTVQELITVIKQKISSFKRDTTGGSDKIFKFDLDLHDALTATALPIDLGADAAGIDLGLDASAKLDLVNLEIC